MAHPAYKLASGEAGSSSLATAGKWLTQVKGAREAAQLCLYAALTTSPAELDIKVLIAQGLEAATVAGGIDESLVVSARERASTVLELRAQAVASLRAAQAAVHADQDVASLEAALLTAQEAGVAHPSFVIDPFVIDPAVGIRGRLRAHLRRVRVAEPGAPGGSGGGDGA